MPTTPQDPTLPGAKTIVSRADATVAPAFVMPAAPLRVAMLNVVDPVARLADRTHNFRLALHSVWLK